MELGVPQAENFCTRLAVNAERSTPCVRMLGKKPSPDIAVKITGSAMRCADWLGQ